MPRIYNATFQPFTYDELATPIREMTQAHQKVEEDYNNNMLVVDSLRQRAMNEPDAKWSQQIIQYADQLEGYAMDLARNGLTRENRNNLLNMKRGYGTTVSPVLMAMQREKELQSVRDKNPGVRNVFSQMPTIDQIIADPNIGQNWYSGEQVFNDAKALGDAASKREVEIFSPQNINAFYYKYGKKTGFSNDEIKDIENNSILAPLLQRVYNQFGWNDDSGLSESQRNQLKNEAITGMLAGVTYDEDWHFNQRKDDPLYYLNYEEKKRQMNSQDYPTVGSATKSKRPNLTFGTSFSPRQQKENDNLRNNIIANKNIVTDVVYDVNGNHYNISDDYVNTILNGLNGKNKNNDRWSNFYIYSPTVGGQNRNLGEQYVSESIQKTANTYGITKNDTVESAKKKIERWLNDQTDYTDLADATKHVALQVWIDPEEFSTVKSKYNSHNSYSLEQSEDGTWHNSGKKHANLKDYNPVRIDITGDDAVVVWSHKDDNTKEQIVTPYYDQTYKRMIVNDYVGNERSGGALYGMKKYNEQVQKDAKNIKLNKLNDLDDDKLYEYGIDKGAILQMINNTQDYTSDNRDLVEQINDVYKYYYERELSDYYNQLEYNPNSEDLMRKIIVTQNRLDNINKRISIYEDMSDDIDRAAAGTTSMAKNLFITNKGKDQVLE